MDEIKALRAAIRNKYKPEVMLLLQTTQNWNCQDANGNTLLHIAIETLVKILQDQMLHKTDFDDVLTVCQDSINIVHLLTARANIAYQNKKRQYPVHKLLDIIDYFDHDIINELLDKVLNEKVLESTTNPHKHVTCGLNFLHLVIIKSKWKAARSAIRKDINVTLKTVCLESALTLLCYHDNAPLDLVQQLARPDNINAQDANGFAPLHLVAQRGNQKCIEVLMKYGASADIGSLLQNNALPIEEYCQCCTENLNSDIYVNLLPTQSSYVRTVLVTLMFYLVRTIPCNYDEVATILEITLLNITEPKLKV